MNGGLASPAARRSAVPEPAPRARREPPARPPALELAAPRVETGGRDAMPSTRERMRASFGAESPAAGGPEAMPLPLPGAEVLPPEAEAPTTRERIANRALAAPDAAASPAPVVVSMAEARERRRERQQAAETPPPAPPVAQLAPVIPLRPTPTTLARPPPPAPAESAASARAPPAAEAPEAEAAPEAIGQEVVPEPEAGPTPSTVETEPAAAAPAEAVAVPGAEPEAAPTAEPEAGPGVEPEAEPAAEPAAEAAAPEVAPVAPAGLPGVIHNPEDEPGFQAMKESARLAGVRTKAHQPGKEGAATAQGASAPDPQTDIGSQAAHEQEEAMGVQQPGPFDPVAFKLAVKQAIEGMAPPATLEEADEFEESGKAAGASASIHGLVTGGRESSERGIATATRAPPNVADKEAKTPGEMVNDHAGPPLPGVGAAGALPQRRPDWLIDLTGGPLQVEAKMAEANVTEEQLARANESDFSAALDAREEVREHAETAPGEYRAHEGMVLEQGQVAAEGVAAGQLEAMHASRTETLGGVLAKKEKTKTADQQLHDEVHQKILDIHERTQADVVLLLETLDTTVDAVFTAGEKAARDEFERYVADKMRAYKADRYGGWFGGAYWLKDKLLDLPDEVNDFYRDGRANYLAAMDRLIEVIATLVGMLLGAAQARIQTGREEVRTYVEGLPDSARKVGADAAADLDNRFDQLASDVDAKRDELVDTIARKYVESRDELDSRIKELQEANKGLVSKAIDAVVGVIKTIYELGKLLLRVLLKAAAAIGDIIAHPIRFLENLVGAVKGGLDRFVSRIAVHLQKSLLDLLFGELGSAGITMPAQLDFAGILDLVLQVLGLTYAGIRERVVKRFGEPVVAQMEEKVDIFKTLVKDGVAGLWGLIREKIADLEDLVVGKVKEYIIERVIKAGIGYIVALLNPAAAFIKACQGIYQIVMFIVERAKQIAAFVEAILDSIAAIAQGNIGTAIEKVESALANGLSLAIAFLARLANLGALSEKVRSIIALVRKPITRIVDQIIFGAARVYRRTVGVALAFGKEKVQSGKELLKGKTRAEQEQIKHKPEPAAVPTEQADGQVAAPTAPLPEAAGPGPLVVHESFSSEGNTHEVYTGADGKQLILSSRTPTPITAVPDPTGELDRLHVEYLAARARYDAALAPLAANPHARTGWTARLAEVNAIVDRIVVRIRQLRPDDSPGASAPGIGDVRRHGHQGTSIRDGPPVWYLESEHIMPFAVGKMLWDAVGQIVPGRGRIEDDQQTTIMLYKGASDRKSAGDGPAIRAFASQYMTILHTAIARLRERAGLRDVRRVGESEAWGEFRDAFAKVLGGMASASASAVERTKTAVRDDHRHADASGQTNGARRAEPKRLPSNAEITRAAGIQYDNVVDLARNAVEAARRE